MRPTSSRWILAPVFISGTGVALAAPDKSGARPQVLSLPSGPGSIEGLGESFEPQFNTGTASYSVQIEVPPAAAGYVPKLTLQYDSGRGNGPFGIGWELSLPWLQRQTDKGLPRYVDAPNDQDDDLVGVADESDERDTFIYSSGEELVELAGGFYRCENENEFIRCNRSGSGWIIDSRDGSRMVLGPDSNSRIQDDEGDWEFRWQIAESRDSNGNTVLYDYFRHQGQLYCWRIRYGLKSASAQTYHAVVLGYESRPDTLTDFRSRFAVTTGLRCKSISVITQGALQPGSEIADHDGDGWDDSLVRRYLLDYEPTSPVSLLSEVRIEGADGFGRHDGPCDSCIPPVSFAYRACTGDELQPPLIASFENPPPTFPGSNADLLDVNADGLTDLLETPPSGTEHRFYLNLGRNRFADAVESTTNPAWDLESPSVRLADLDGDGRSDMVSENPPGSGLLAYHRLQTWGDWAPVPITSAPTMSFSFDVGSDDVAFVDINNDKSIDILVSDAAGPWGYTLNGGIDDLGQQKWKSFSLPQPLPDSLSSGRLRLADMNGDRLLDLVSVRESGVGYFPSMGYGQWSSEVKMFGAPALDDLYSELQLEDVNGDGLADAVFVDYSSVYVWLNGYADRFLPVKVIANTPSRTPDTAIRIADMNGNGTRDILWANPDAGEDAYRYLELFPAGKPNLLTDIDNGLGLHTQVCYRSSTEYYLDARDSGDPWVAAMPFPVDVVDEVVDTVLIGDMPEAYRSSMEYWGGYYDPVEKEFRGFEREVSTEWGDASAPTKLTMRRFHTGKVEESLKGKPISTTITDENRVKFFSEEHEWDTRILGVSSSGQRVTFPFASRMEQHVFEGNATPAIIRTEYAYDDYGNLAIENKFGLVEDGDVAAGGDEVLVSRTFLHSVSDSQWMVDLKSSETVRDLSGRTWSHEQYDYDDRGNLLREDAWLDTDGRLIPTIRNEYDAWGNIVRLTDPNDHFRTIGYDDIFHAFPVRETIQLDGYTLEMTAAYHTGFGTVTSAVDFAQATTEFEYDRFGRLTAIKRPLGAEERFAYVLRSGASSILKQQKENSSGSTYDTYTFFDGLKRQIGIKTEAEPENGAPKWRYLEAVSFNSRQLPNAKWLPYFSGTSLYESPDPIESHSDLEYDVRDRVSQTTNPDLTCSRIVYEALTWHAWDENDNPKDCLDAESAPGSSTPTSFYNDGLGRLVKVVERNRIGNAVQEYTTTYAWSTLGDLIQMIDAQQNLKALGYDSLRRRTLMNDPDRGRMVYEYDDAGNLLQTTDAKRQVVKYSYDFANRLLTENYLDRGCAEAQAGCDPVDVAYYYDLPSLNVNLGDGSTASASFTGGRLASVSDLSGEEYNSYDARGNTLWTTKVIRDPQLDVLVPFATRFAYDAMDRVTDVHYPDNDHAHYEYNDASDTEAVHGGGHSGAVHIINNMDYEPAGRLALIVYGNGIRTSHTYDNRDRLDKLMTVSPVVGELIHYGYKYDSVSNVHAIVDERPLTAIATGVPRRNTQVFAYDDLYRLTQVRYVLNEDSSTNEGQIDYSYDAIGNMLSKMSPNINDINLAVGTMEIGGGQCGDGPEAGPCRRRGRQPGDPPGPHAITRVSNGVAAADVFEYDTNGNIKSLNGATLSWDFKDRLVRYEAGKTVAEYAYDYNDRRISKRVTVDTRTTRTLYANRTFEMRPDQVPTKYVFADDMRVAHITGTLDPSQPRVQRFWLSPGWNLTTLSVETDHTSAEVFGKDSRVYTWNGETYVAVDGSLAPLVGRPLWIEVPTPRVPVVSGRYESSAEDGMIPGGQRLVAWGRLEPFVAAAHLPSADWIQGYDNQSATWLLVAPELPGFLSDQWRPVSTSFWLMAPQDSPVLSGAIEAQNVLFYHSDHLGSTNAISRMDGVVDRELSYYPFGESRHTYGSTSLTPMQAPFLFIGKEADTENTLIYADARYYSARLGRFIAVDPLFSHDPVPNATEDDSSADLRNPQALNMYSYGLNQPTKYTDGSGLDARLATFARTRVDSPYVKGGREFVMAGPKGNRVQTARMGPHVYDCIGLLHAVLNEAGYKATLTQFSGSRSRPLTLARTLIKNNDAKAVSWKADLSNLKPGDVVFLERVAIRKGGKETLKGGHVGIVGERNGERTLIQAGQSRTFGNGVKEVPLQKYLDFYLKNTPKGQEARMGVVRFPAEDTQPAGGAK